MTVADLMQVSTGLVQLTDYEFGLDFGIRSANDYSTLIKEVANAKVKEVSPKVIAGINYLEIKF